MALSNIFREPRREITESVVGLVPFVGFIALDVFLTRWICRADTHRDWGQIMGIFFVIVVGTLMALFGLVLLALFTHFIGEEICGFLARHGLELRPKNRPGQNVAQPTAVPPPPVNAIFDTSAYYQQLAAMNAAEQVTSMQSIRNVGAAFVYGYGATGKSQQ